MFLLRIKKKKKKKVKQHNYSTIFNKKNVFEHQISISEYFLKDHDIEDWSNESWKFSFAITGINYILKYNKNRLFKIIIIFQFFCSIDQMYAALVI